MRGPQCSSLRAPGSRTTAEAGIIDSPRVDGAGITEMTQPPHNQSRGATGTVIHVYTRASARHNPRAHHNPIALAQGLELPKRA